MNGSSATALMRRLANWPHVLLALQLISLQTLAFGGWRFPEVRLLWVVVIGLFLIWQPFVAGEHKIHWRQAILLLGAVFLSTAILGPWLLLVWCGALAAAIGTRVVGLGYPAERAGYLLALGYLIGIAVLGVVPEIAPALQRDLLEIATLTKAMPFLLLLLLGFPSGSAGHRKGDTFDLLYGLLVFLVLAVFVLGTLAYMLVSGVSYVEALIRTSMTLAGALLVVAWVWNPRAGFSGIGTAVSRYLLSAGVPLEEWLIRLSQESERVAAPDEYLEAVMNHLVTIPWVCGVSWAGVGAAMTVGERTSHEHHCEAQGTLLTAYFKEPPSAAMRWHVELLLRLAYEFYWVKRQGQQLQRLSYAKAVYETGARVTHDVKNLLQSLQVLCYAATHSGNSAGAADLVARQLPQIAERLQATLQKLQAPQQELMEAVSELHWWQNLKGRYAHLPILWGDDPESARELPGGLFDRVAENLLHNAYAKKQREPGIEIRVSCNNGELTVIDNGSAIPSRLAASLLREPVESEDGLGIGLYHAAKQAADLGYRLVIAENRDGCVAFSMLPPA